jgi:hypothetical protein
MARYCIVRDDVDDQKKVYNCNLPSCHLRLFLKILNLRLLCCKISLKKLSGISSKFYATPHVLDTLILGSKALPTNSLLTLSIICPNYLLQYQNVFMCNTN